jgi:hypothetical protein
MVRKRNIDREIEGFLKRGYYPARTAHLHPDLKKLLKDAGIRPGIKQCFANCQQILLASAGFLQNGSWPRVPILADRLAYHEGIGLSSVEKMPILHAWLTLDGVVQDPTSQSILHDRSHRYTAEDVRIRVVERQAYGPVDELALAELMNVVWSDGPKPV